MEPIAGLPPGAALQPVVIADVNGDGSVTAADAALIGTATPLLPAIPAGVTLTPVSASPFVSAPVTLSANAGGTVTVPVTIDRSVALSSGQIVLNYDPAALDLMAVRADPASGLTVSVAPPSSGGQVTVTLSGTGAATAGTLALFDFTVASSVQAGTDLAIDLSTVSVNGRALASTAGCRRDGWAHPGAPGFRRVVHARSPPSPGRRQTRPAPPCVPPGRACWGVRLPDQTGR